MKRIAVTNDKVYYYDSANYKVQIKEFRKTNENNERPYYYDFAGFDFAKNGIRIISLFDNTNGKRLCWVHTKKEPIKAGTLSFSLKTGKLRCWQNLKVTWTRWW